MFFKKTPFFFVFLGFWQKKQIFLEILSKAVYINQITKERLFNIPKRRITGYENFGRQCRQQLDEIHAV